MHQVKAVIETSRFSKDHKCHKVFYVLCPLNLNDIPDIEQCNTNSIAKKFSYKLVKTGNVVLTATTDLKGYTVGQVIQLRTDIENKSGRDTSTIVASLIQKVAYKSRRWIYDLRSIAEVEGSAVKAWKHAEWKEQILVPALPQSILQGCSLIHIDYYIQLSLKSPEVSVALPIYIGNIPVNRIPLSPSHLVPNIPSPVVPSAPPEEEEAARGYSHPMDNISIPTKSHSQQQPFSYAPGLTFPEARADPEQITSPNRPALCLSTGSTVPYYAEGAVVPVATASSLILPPEYSTWGYPYGSSFLRTELQQCGIQLEQRQLGGGPEITTTVNPREEGRRTASLGSGSPPLAGGLSVAAPLTRRMPFYVPTCDLCNPATSVCCFFF
ncbi:arrestin domain-containing protein 1 isoform X2 [Erythrolamprus reginae]|uniref:arrestin domain-containing protein 1 isoform X2 n=1 Tax=Erythrolamprus reginae TaxID=121349 RepID=UPI00396C79F5